MERKQERKEIKKQTDRERERETQREIFLAFRLSKLDGPRRKVDPRIVSYAWVPKS